MDYKLLKALAAVLDAGGFEKAAQRLNLTQSAVSQRIRLLEDQIGAILLTRTSPPVATEAGSRILAHYRKVHHLESELFSDPILGVQSDVNRTLSIGVNADSLATWLIDTLAPLINEFGALLDLHVDDQEHTLHLLRQGSVLACITTSEPPLQGCKVEPLGFCPYCLVATPNFAGHHFPHPNALPKNISQIPTVFFNRKDDLTRRFFNEVLHTEVTFEKVHYIPSSEKYLDMIYKGGCYGVVPLHQISDILQSNQVIECFPEQRLYLPLFFHCWNIRSSWLTDFTTAFVASAQKHLSEKSSP